MRNRAFTLTELIAIIAIVSVLAAVIIPTISKLHSSSRSVACLNNLRQIGKAFEISSSENNYRYPAPLAPNADGSGAWHDVLSVQIYSSTFGRLTGSQIRANVFKCPAANEGGTIISYGMNSDLAIFAAGANKWNLYGFTKEPIMQQRIPNPSKTCLVIESIRSQSGSGNTFTTRVLPTTYRHSSNLNILYCDGHVETKPASETPPTADTEAGNMFWRSGEG